LIGQALRTEVRMYPEIAIRELVANALIHQDFHITGAGPMIGWRSNVSVNSAWV
jgi:predicted HTH transcriptional regulator